MGTLTNLNGITEPQIPAAIARDTEVASAIASHVSAVDPHPTYLTQPEGDGRYRQTATPLVDGDIPATIARDAEFVAADLIHTNLADPHPNLWTRIANAFLTLTGGQTIIKNNPAMSPVSYTASQNSLEIRTTDGSNPILGFHRAGFSATALYHLGYGNNSLRIRNADGFDGAILHDGNIGERVITNRLDDSTTVVRQKLITGTTAATQGGVVQLDMGIATARIQSISLLVLYEPEGLIGPAYSITPSFEYMFWTSNSIIFIVNKLHNSGSILSKPIRVLVTYTN